MPMKPAESTNLPEANQPESIATQNNQPLADALQMRLKLHEARSPYREKPQPSFALRARGLAGMAQRRV